MIHLLFLTPLFVAFIFLVTALVYQVNNIFSGTVFYHLPPLILFLIPLLWLLSREKLIRFQVPANSWMYIGFLAPFAIIYPWIMAGEPLSGQGYLFFMDWLGREPNFGPFNFQVFFAIFCIISGAIIPSLFMFRALNSIAMRPLLILFFINIVVFIPVFFKMDLLLWYYALVSPPGINSSVSLLYGPLLRTASLFCCAIHIINRLK